MCLGFAALLGVALIYPWGGGTPDTDEKTEVLDTTRVQPPVVEQREVSPPVRPRPKKRPPRPVSAPTPPPTQLARDTSFVYQLPYDTNVAYYVYQGFTTESTHKDLHAVDVAMPIGTPILAARDGVVGYAETDSWFAPMGIQRDEAYRDMNNGIVVDHEDGTWAMYGHIRKGSAVVSPGDSVRAGQKIGLSGTAGSPHLHFHVKLREEGESRSFTWRWSTADHPDGVVPQKGDFPMRPESTRQLPSNLLAKFFTTTVDGEPKRTFQPEEAVRIVALFHVPDDREVTLRFTRPNLEQEIERVPKQTPSRIGVWYDLAPGETKYARGGVWKTRLYLQDSFVDSMSFYILK